MEKYLRKWQIGLCLALLLCACSGKEAPHTKPLVGVDMSEVQFTPDFLLSDPHGKRYRLADFKGNLVLVFFGYTHCPDICPTTMLTLKNALRLLGSKAKDVRVLFITLDPMRDTPAVLLEYLGNFDKQFIALSGTSSEIQTTTKAFKVFSQQVPNQGRMGYTIDHSAGSYVFDRTGKLRLYLEYGAKAQDIAHDLDILLL